MARTEAQIEEMLGEAELPLDGRGLRSTMDAPGIRSTGR